MDALKHAGTELGVRGVAELQARLRPYIQVFATHEEMGRYDEYGFDPKHEMWRYVQGAWTPTMLARCLDPRALPERLRQDPKHPYGNRYYLVPDAWIDVEEWRLEGV